MSVAKHYITDPTHAVLSALESLPRTNPSLLVDLANKIVYRNPTSIAEPTNVSVVCGGGSGHEPGFAGFVGEGLLTACVAGTIFASPGAEQVRTCLQYRLPPESKGVLVIATNYTGDVLNFGMGVEKARAMGKKVEMVVVGDDVGVGRERSGKVGRRGLSGAALVVKVCCALAEQGVGLEDCARIGRLVAKNLVSLGASLRRVHVPGRGIEEAREEEERLGLGLIEIGMGVHNEPGCEKVRTDLPGLVRIMLQQMLDQSDKDRAYVNIGKSDETILLINNFGGISNLELGAITNEVCIQLNNNYGLKPRRIVQGTLWGSLDGPGFAVSVLKLSDTGLSDGRTMIDLIDAPVNAIGWPRCVSGETWERKYELLLQKPEEAEDEGQPSDLKLDPAKLRSALEPALKKLIAAEAEVTKYDSVVGDGDCGIGLKRGAEAVLEMLPRITSDDAMTAFAKICATVENNMDGTSGALYAIFLNSLASNLRLQDTSSLTPVTIGIWAKALSLSVDGLGKYTPAQPGDRTLMDALTPFVDVLQRTGDVKKAAEAAREGADKTKGMKASLGRSVYVGGTGFQEVPDPGAYGLSIFLSGIANAVYEG
ncbi:triose/dihydroxyacetone kinase / FAD-AMP lyase (cyclizing), partial [Lecanoromycetidae sp. Uapishka_2]